VDTVFSEDGSSVPFSWSAAGTNIIEMRYYWGWKTVVRTDGGEPEETMSFSSLNCTPYEFSDAYNGSSWQALNSTIVYIKTGNEPLTVSQMLENGQLINDVVGVWWQTGWEGMGTKPIHFPILIPANQRAMIQINHVITGNISLQRAGPFSDGIVNRGSIPALTFEEVNPTKYEVKVENATQPFFLVLSESYDPQWKAYVLSNNVGFNNIIASYPNYNTNEAKFTSELTAQDISFLFARPMKERYHFMVDAYANAWYINPAEFGNKTEFTITLYYGPQSYYYLGILTSGAALVLLAIVLLSKSLPYFYSAISKIFLKKSQ